MSSIFIGVSHSDMKSNRVSVKRGMERRKEEEEEVERFHRGRRYSLQHDGNKEQMECSCRNELTFTFHSLLSFFASFLPFFPNFFPQE